MQNKIFDEGITASALALLQIRRGYGDVASTRYKFVNIENSENPDYVAASRNPEDSTVLRITGHSRCRPMGMLTDSSHMCSREACQRGDPSPVAYEGRTSPIPSMDRANA